MLQINNLEVVYNDIILVLRGISLQVADGSIIAFLGSNGAGKSTTLRAISGLLDYEDGEIKKPVRKLRISENLLKMSKRVVAIGKDRKQIQWWEVYTPTFIPTIKIADCNITAATQ